MKPTRLMAILAILIAANGCIAIPPLINVTHKEEQNIGRRLDAMEQRLNSIEKKLDQKP